MAARAKISGKSAAVGRKRQPVKRKVAADKSAAVGRKRQSVKRKVAADKSAAVGRKRQPVKRKAAADKSAAVGRKRQPVAPIELGAAAAAEWSRLAAMTAPSNATIFALYCAAVGRAVEANKAIEYIASLAPAARGFIIKKGENSWGENPAVRTAQEADKHAFEFATRLGLMRGVGPAGDKSARDGLHELPGWSD